MLAGGFFLHQSAHAARTNTRAFAFDRANLEVHMDAARGGAHRMAAQVATLRTAQAHITDAGHTASKSIQNMVA